MALKPKNQKYTWDMEIWDREYTITLDLKLVKPQPWRSWTHKKTQKYTLDLEIQDSETWGPKTHDLEHLGPKKTWELENLRKGKPWPTKLRSGKPDAPWNKKTYSVET